MQIHPAKQGSPEWLTARSGIVTASESHNLFTPEFKERTGEMRKSYLAVKLAERWIGGPLPGWTSVDMEIGRILEEECLPFFELTTGETIQRVGLVTRDDGRCGCSPDGLIGEESGIEAKCPRPETHVKYLISGTLPKDYAVQVHTSMFVTGRPSWYFMSYARHFPPFILQVKQDAGIATELARVIAEFNAELDDSFLGLCKINGGPPARQLQTHPAMPIPGVDVPAGAGGADGSVTEPLAPVRPLLPPGCPTLNITVKAVASKKGPKATRYGVCDTNDIWFNTFSVSLYKLAEALKGQRAVVYYTTKTFNEREQNDLLWIEKGHHDAA
jgi:hypothetical protein